MEWFHVLSCPVDTIRPHATVACMAQTETIRTVEDDTAVRLDGSYAVVLFNDDHNSMDSVVKALMRVFGHPLALSEKIMREAHDKGRAIAEVEGKELAVVHKQQLTSLGLTAGVEKIL